MQVSRADFSDWQKQPITVAIAKDIAETVEVMIAQFLRRRESNPADDQWIKGYIEGVQSLLNWEPEFIEGSKDA